MKQLNISSFNNYVLRTPSFPLIKYLDLLNNYTFQKALSFLEDSFFEEAIFLASPDLLENLKEIKKNSTNLKLEKKKLEFTLLKYIARICSRCTPFGLFAGCTVGEFSSESKIELKNKDFFAKFTQFDMHFWVQFLKKIEQNEDIINSLKFYPNTSIYLVGDFYRYIEYSYVDGKRNHSITALRKTSLLKKIISHCDNGLLISDILKLIIDDESEKKDALNFIRNLINNQFLISELEPTLTGNDELDRVSKTIEKESINSSLKHLISNLKDLNSENNSFGKIEKYDEIKRKLRLEQFEFEDRYLIQSDLNISTKINCLNKNHSKKVIEALSFLNSIQKDKISNNLNQFITAYKNRYENREMPLAHVLDSEIGIGYTQISKNNGNHPLLENFSFQSNKSKNEEVWSEIDIILEKKLQDCHTKNLTEIDLSENDFPSLKANSENTPSTFSTMIEIAKINNEEIIILESSGGTSALKMLGRFCNGNEEIHNLSKKIIKKEKEHYKGKILAEILHMPESRTGNVIRRPMLRDYEIPFLSNSSLERKHQLKVNDLTISIVNDSILLKSKKLNNEIIPFLSNAHNYSVNSLPIYHFLCDLQQQNLKPVFNFNWGILKNHYNYFPRVKYKNIIISKAKWMVFNYEIEKISTDINEFNNWRIQRKISRFVNLVNYDNTLLIDLESEICIKMLLNEIKKSSKATLEEFLFSDESVVSDSNGNGFCNQFIISFYKN